METKLYVAEQVAKYIERSNYKNVFFLEDQEVWGKTVTNVCRKACKDKGIGFKVLGFKKWRAFRKLAKEIGRTLINDKG